MRKALGSSPREGRRREEPRLQGGAELRAWGGAASGTGSSLWPGPAVPPAPQPAFQEARLVSVPFTDEETGLQTQQVPTAWLFCWSPALQGWGAGWAQGAAAQECQLKIHHGAQDRGQVVGADSSSQGPGVGVGGSPCVSLRHVQSGAGLTPASPPTGVGLGTKCSSPWIFHVRHCCGLQCPQRLLC